MEQEVSLVQMLDARERRVWHQQELLGAYGKPLVCFTMNIAGPVKDSPLIRRGFARGRQLLERQFLRCGIKPLKIDLSKAVTGPEAFYVLDAEPLTIKKLTTLVEDASPLGRLFDMDVLRPDGKKVDREELHLEGRKCLICGGPAKVCSSRRVHPVAELQARTTAILTETMDTLDAATAARQAVRALLYEVTTTPKPGLVDRRNSGSHTDMDSFTFMSSAASLYPYFEACTRAGRKTADGPAPETFAALRPLGCEAEGEMLAATHGVNTHKGAIFSIGIVCAALGRLDRPGPRAGGSLDHDGRADGKRLCGGHGRECRYRRAEALCAVRHYRGAGAGGSRFARRVGVWSARAGKRAGRRIQPQSVRLRGTAGDHCQQHGYQPDRPQRPCDATGRGGGAESLAGPDALPGRSHSLRAG